MFEVLKDMPAFFRDSVITNFSVVIFFPFFITQDTCFTRSLYGIKKLRTIRMALYFRLYARIKNSNPDRAYLFRRFFLQISKA